MQNIDHIRYHLQAYCSGIEDVIHQKKVFNTTQRLERHFEYQRHTIKENSELFIAPLFSTLFIIFYDHLHWIQKNMDEPLKNFACITESN